MIKPLRIIWSIILILSFSVLGRADKFTLSQERPGNFMGIIEFLGLYPTSPMPSIPFYLRSPLPKKYGNYFYSPKGAEKKSLTAMEKVQLKDKLRVFIDSSFYDSYVIDNSQGYQYAFSPDDIRRENYIRYNHGDTIFVISGLFGKFISFYWAIPAAGIPSVGNLQAEIKRISPSYMEVPEKLFKINIQDSLYFYEYVDRDSLMRVRAYNISEIDSWDNNGQPLLIYNYNLIEITKFYDKGVIP